MKTLTTTLSIFALLLSSTAFSLDLNEDIQPPLQPRDPGFEVIIKSNTNEIIPPLQPRDPGFELNF